eukprot:GFUD01014761.1.p1 GENE.GFUD01014761.1~~GFUD01014761.1.p1  ORF type:complete len:379 (-),score=116.70 GFUD01014761.1:75-1211(-)
MKNSRFQEYTGSNFLRQRLVLATLTSRSVRISSIRTREDDPGLQEAEAGFIRLLDKLTNGSKVEVNETGTQLTYQPGVLLGGRVEHQCSLARGLGYWLEPILALAPFCKNPLHLILTGVTNNQLDPSPDMIKASCLPVLRKFLLDDTGLDLTVTKRGAAPGGGGQVVLKCPVKKSPRPVQVLDQGKIKRIRGVAWGVRVSPSVANRVVESAKGKLLQFIPDIYIYTDHMTGKSSGNSPGFGLILTAETNTGTFLSAEVCSNPAGGGLGPTVPEDLGVRGAQLLMEEIFRGGCADSLSQSLAVVLMGLGPPDVSKFMVGPLSPYTVQCLRHVRDFMDLTFKLETLVREDEEDRSLKMGADKVVMTCVGVGFTNLSKKTA